MRERRREAWRWYAAHTPFHFFTWISEKASREEAALVCAKWATAMLAEEESRFGPIREDEEKS